MRRSRILLLLCLALGMSAGVTAQDTLSQQVLRLLTRTNYWSGTNTFARTVGLTLESGSIAPTNTDNALYNLGGNLYFNGVLVATSAGAGTVTSVGLSMPAVFSVAGSPVTSSGTLAVTLATESANRLWAGPTTGSAATPTFRALVAADIPDLSSTYLTPAGAQALSNKTGNISQWTNDSGYVTSSSIGTNITAVGTLVTGTWHATVIDGQYGGTGVSNSGKTITLGGNLTTSGANNLTFTTTAATNVTLPTSGTLATTAVTTLSSLVSVGTITTGTWNATTLDPAYGGTGLTSYAQGDLLYASGATTLAKLPKNATATRYLSNTGSSNNPAWAQVDLTNGVTGTLPAANGGTSVTSAPTNGQLLIGNGSSFTLATLTGTANQVTVTGGSGSITLALPQSIATASTPQWARIGLGTGAGASAVLTTSGQVNIALTDIGSCASTATADWSTGMSQKVTLTGGCTITFSNPLTGVSEYRLLVIQDGTGSRTMAWPGSVKWQGGSAPTLTTTANKIDICWFRYDGTSYLGDCSLNY